MPHAPPLEEVLLAGFIRYRVSRFFNKGPDKSIIIMDFMTALLWSDGH